MHAEKRALSHQRMILSQDCTTMHGICHSWTHLGTHADISILALHAEANFTPQGDLKVPLNTFIGPLSLPSGQFNSQTATHVSSISLIDGATVLSLLELISFHGACCFIPQLTGRESSRKPASSINWCGDYVMEFYFEAFKATSILKLKWHIQASTKSSSSRMVSSISADFWHKEAL